MPTQVTSDPDFMSASAGEQAAYLKTIDPDFANAPATDQNMYLAHIRRVAPDVPRPQVQPQFANPLPTEKIPIAGAMAQPIGELGANLAYDPAFRKQTGEYGAGSAAAVGGMAAAPGAIASTAPIALPFLRQAAAKHPLITRAVASEAISLARRIPFLGKLVPSYAEMLPWLKGGS